MRSGTNNRAVLNGQKCSGNLNVEVPAIDRSWVLEDMQWCELWRDGVYLVVSNMYIPSSAATMYVGITMYKEHWKVIHATRHLTPSLRLERYQARVSLREKIQCSNATLQCDAK